MAYMAPEVPPIDDSIVLAISLKIEAMSIQTPGEEFFKALQMAESIMLEVVECRGILLQVIAWGLAYNLYP